MKEKIAVLKKEKERKDTNESKVVLLDGDSGIIDLKLDNRSKSL